MANHAQLEFSNNLVLRDVDITATCRCVSSGMNTKMITFGVTFTVALAFDQADAGNDKTVVLVEVNQAQSSPDGFSKLSKALSLTKTSEGVLKAADPDGRVLIELSQDSALKLKNDPSVKTVTENAPSNCTAVKRLKISYSSGKAPTAEELRSLGLRIVEDYGKGNFLIVEPTNGIIDAGLVSQLERNAKIQHVAPVLHIKAIQSDKS